MSRAKLMGVSAAPLRGQSRMRARQTRGEARLGMCDSLESGGTVKAGVGEIVAIVNLEVMLIVLSVVKKRRKQVHAGLSSRPGALN